MHVKPRLCPSNENTLTRRNVKHRHNAHNAPEHVVGDQRLALRQRHARLQVVVHLAERLRQRLLALQIAQTV
jgi:hypothetical protein